MRDEDLVFLSYMQYSVFAAPLTEEAFLSNVCFGHLCQTSCGCSFVSLTLALLSVLLVRLSTEFFVVVWSSFPNFNSFIIISTLVSSLSYPVLTSSFIQLFLSCLLKSIRKCTCVASVVDQSYK